MVEEEGEEVLDQEERKVSRIKASTWTSQTQNEVLVTVADGASRVGVTWSELDVLSAVLENFKDLTASPPLPTPLPSVCVRACVFKSAFQV